jgi:hypothetical protein
MGGRTQFGRSSFVTRQAERPYATRPVRHAAALAARCMRRDGSTPHRCAAEPPHMRIAKVGLAGIVSLTSEANLW